MQSFNESVALNVHLHSDSSSCVLPRLLWHLLESTLSSCRHHLLKKTAWISVVKSQVRSADDGKTRYFYATFSTKSEEFEVVALHAQPSNN